MNIKSFGDEMKTVLNIAFMIFLLASCQTHQSVSKNSGREIANTRVLKNFIDDIAIQSERSAQRYTSEEIEQKILAYIKRKEKDMAYGNWEKMGINKNQADDIKSIYDDGPHMIKVQKWVAENITKIIKISDDIAANAYNLMMRHSQSTINPYTFGRMQSGQMMFSRRNSTSPFKSLNEKSERVVHEVSTIKDQAIKKIYMENYMSFTKRGADHPAISANAHEIVESATQITKKTGHSGMGSGCKAFNEKASFEVIEMKANIDIYRAQLIEEKAYRKAGREFASIDDIPKQNRLTQVEIDEATEEAFENVLGYTKLEAKAAVNRLKGKPCQVY